MKPAIFLSLRAAARVLWWRSNLLTMLGIASGEEHTCPGGRCQGERPRNDIIYIMGYYHES